MDEIVSKSEFAARANVSPARVSQWLSEGKISGDALVGEGRGAKIRVSIATAQLHRKLDISQRLGNGLGTRLDLPPPAPDKSPDASAASSSAPRAEPVFDSLEEQIKREKLEQLQFANRRHAREEAATAGRLTDAEAATRQMGRIAAQTVTIFEGGMPAIANAFASQFGVPQRDAIHLLRGEFRKLRAAAAHALRRRLADLPAYVDVDLGDAPDAAAPRPGDEIGEP